jgi:hypothetical protein
VAHVLFSMIIYRRLPLLFSYPPLSPPPLNFVLAIKKSTLSSYFMTFHIWPLIFWFLSLILSNFIKFYFILFSISSLDPLSWFLISSSLVHILLIFIFDLDSFVNLIFFQSCPSIQSLMIFKVLNVLISNFNFYIFYQILIYF